MPQENTSKQSKETLESESILSQTLGSNVAEKIPEILPHENSSKDSVQSSNLSESNIISEPMHLTEFKEESSRRTLPRRLLEAVCNCVDIV